MLQHCDFEEQPSAVLRHGAAAARPDRAPAGRQAMVVDSKVPLEAFLDAHETDRRAGADAPGCSSTRATCATTWTSWAARATGSSSASSPEMVVMFLPGETLFSAALQHDLSLIEHGLEHRVLLASPITLIALLTTVAHGWRQDALADNYREVARLGREFYDRVATFTDYFDDVRRKLDGAVQAYNQAAGSFESRVLVSARRLRELDVTTSPEIAHGRAHRHRAPGADVGRADGRSRGGRDPARPWPSKIEGSCPTAPRRSNRAATRFRPRDRHRRPADRPPRRPRPHAVSARAQRLPAHRPRQVDLPELRRRRRVRRPVQPALRRHQPREGRRRVRRLPSRRTSAGWASTGASRLFYASDYFEQMYSAGGAAHRGRPRLRGQPDAPTRSASTAAR